MWGVRAHPGPGPASDSSSPAGALFERSLSGVQTDALQWGLLTSDAFTGQVHPADAALLPGGGWLVADCQPASLAVNRMAISQRSPGDESDTHHIVAEHLPCPGLPS